MNNPSVYYSEKDFNLAIYDAIKKVAEVIFNNIVCAPGMYAAADIAKEIKGGPVVSLVNGAYKCERTEDYYFTSKRFAWRNGFDAAAVYSVELESFSCKFTAWRVFEILKKYTAVFSVPTSKKAVFVREVAAAPVVAAFDVPAAAIAKQLKNSCAVDNLRPVMEGVYFDAARRVLVASDGRIMTVTAAPAAEVAEDYFNDDDKTGAIVSPLLLKKGRISVDSLNMASNNGAAVRTIDGRFPAWRSIVPSYKESQAVNLGNHWPEIKKSAAALAKFTDLQNNPVVLFGESYTNKLQLITTNYEGQEKRETIVLDENFNFTFAIGTNGAQLAKIEKAEKMFLCDPSRAISFVAPGLYTLIMPVLISDCYFDSFNFPYFDAAKNATGENVAVLSGIETEPQRRATEESEPRPARVRGCKSIEYMRYQKDQIKDYYFQKDQNKYFCKIIPIFLRYLQNAKNYLLLDIDITGPGAVAAAHVPAAVYMEDTTTEERKNRFDENYLKRQELIKERESRAAAADTAEDVAAPAAEVATADTAADIVTTAPAGLETVAAVNNIKFDFAPYLEKGESYNNTFAELLKNLNNEEIRNDAYNEIGARALQAAHDFTARLGLVHHSATANELVKIFLANVENFAASQKEETTAEDVAAPAADTANDSEPAAVVSEVANDDTAEDLDSAEDTTAEDVAPVPAEVLANMKIYAAVYLWRSKYSDNEIYAAARELKSAGYLPAGGYFETLRGVRVAKINKKYDFKTGRILKVSIEFIKESPAEDVAAPAEVATANDSEPESRENVADVPTVAPAIASEPESPENIESPAAIVAEDTTAEDVAAPAEVVALVPEVAAIESPAEDDTAADIETGTTAEDVAAIVAPSPWESFALMPEIPTSAATADTAEDTTAEDVADVFEFVTTATAANVTTAAAAFAARARRWFTVAASLLTLLIVGAAVNHINHRAEDVAALVPAEVAAIVTTADDSEPENRENVADVPTTAPAIVSEPESPKTTTARASEPRARRHRRAAVPAEVAALVPDTLTAAAPADTARAIVAAEDTTAAPVALVPEVAEDLDTANDDTAADIETETTAEDVAAPAEVAEDDTADDSESQSDTAPTSTGTTAPAAVAVPAVPGVPAAVVLALLLTL